MGRIRKSLCGDSRRMSDLGFVIASAPERRDLETVQALASAAVQRGHTVSVFLMSEAVRALPGHRAMVALAELGADLVACGQSLERHDIRDLGPASLGSQDDHARLADQARRMVTFT